MAEAERHWPGVKESAHANRAYLGRVVRWLVDAGVRQFLDLGSGIPTLDNVHEVVEQVSPESRVAYVDIDPVAVAHSQRILQGNPRALAVRACTSSPNTWRPR